MCSFVRAAQRRNGVSYFLLIHLNLVEVSAKGLDILQKPFSRIMPSNEDFRLKLSSSKLKILWENSAHPGPWAEGARRGYFVRCRADRQDSETRERLIWLMARSTWGAYYIEVMRAHAVRLDYRTLVKMCTQRQSPNLSDKI